MNLKDHESVSISLLHVNTYHNGQAWEMHAVNGRLDLENADQIRK
jgi:hypothetical protein